MAELKAKYAKEIHCQVAEETKARNEVIAKEIYLSVGRFGIKGRMQSIMKLEKE